MFIVLHMYTQNTLSHFICRMYVRKASRLKRNSGWFPEYQYAIDLFFKIIQILYFES
jgi:hypothetical protein